MNRFTQSALALSLAAAFAAPTFARDEKKADAMSGNASQALERIESDRKEEAKRQGDRKIEVKEMAVWGLGELPPRLMSQACEMLTKDTDQAALQVRQAANILELTASVGKDNGGAEELKKKAEMLREVAMKIETRQVLSADDLQKPFAKAALAAAKYYQEAAAQGVKDNDEEQTGYSLKGASAYLTVAHVFAKQKPSAEVSRAAYDAEIVAVQIIKNSKPTTVAGQDNGATADKGQDKQGLAGDKANLPEGTEQVVNNLKQAIEGTNVVANAE